MEINNKKLFKQQCFINGEWVDSYSKETIDVNNPSTLEIIAKVPKCGKDETNFAISKANEAFNDWKNLPAIERSAYLRRWYNLIEKNQEDLAKIMTLEQGKPLAESRMEIAMANSYVEWNAEEAKRVYGDTIPDRLTDRRSVIIKQPVGVVGSITPWNFPSAMITRKCSPALAVGCPVVLKPASQTPLSAFALVVLAEEAGFPKGVINIVTGTSTEIGNELTNNPIVRKISFTGSTEVGKILLAQCSTTVKKVSMELGGHAPFIVFDDADIDEAVTGAMTTKFRNTGQTCICANRLFIHEKIYDEFLEKFSNSVSKMKVGDGFEEGVISGPLIDEFSLQKVKKQVEDAVNMGAKIAVGGDIHKLGGNFYQPTVLSNVSTKAKITYEETFGPVAPLYKFSTEEEVIKMANDTPYGLASYFYSRDIGRVWRVAEALEYGIVAVNNGAPTKAEMPFGGIKESGSGREGSKYGIDEFLEIKYINMAGI